MKRIPVVNAVRPVLPPASTPDADSTNVVTVDVPVHAPTIVPTASEISACFMFGIFPCLSTIPARDAVPTSVPIVSNISMIQNVIISDTAVNQPILIKSLKSSLNNVVSTISLTGGINEAVASAANGFVWKNSASPAQYITQALSIPKRTAPFIPLCARMIITNNPTNIVTTVSTIVG